MIEKLANKPARTIAGLMSGTSLDGLDIAICQIASEPFLLELQASTTVPFSEDLRARILEACTGDVAIVAQLDIELGRFYADAVGDFCDATGISLDLIGSHGQTIYHEHGITTLQIGEPGFMAERLSCPVISDFRRADIIAGGCGAPLVPAFDVAMFERETEGVIALNIGGIANITAIPAASDSEAKAIAFDTGPGNMVIDGLMQRWTDGTKLLDVEGQAAARGRIDRNRLDRLMAHPFLTKPPPRSTGREEFGDAFCDALVAEVAPADDQAWHDLLTTVTAWTALSIMHAIREHVPFEVHHLIVGGGGTHNRTLMAMLGQRSNALSVASMDQFGIDPDYREAMAFAYLADAFVRNRPGNVPAATGARDPARLGRITMPATI